MVLSLTFGENDTDLPPRSAPSLSRSDAEEAAAELATDDRRRVQSTCRSARTRMPVRGRCCDGEEEHMMFGYGDAWISRNEGIA